MVAGRSWRICVVGVGRMGLPVCANLVQGGHSVVAVDPRPEALAAARAVGARPLANVVGGVDGVGGVELVVSMLPTAGTTIEVARSAMPQLAAGAAWIDMGSNDPATSEALLRAASGLRLDVLDAPVGGGPPEAQAGTLQLFVGGDIAVFERHLAVLECVADPLRMHHMGAHGRGYTAKLLVNLLWFGQALATTEALLLAQASGIDLASMHAALRTSAVAGRFIDNDVRALLAGDYLTTFGLRGCYDELTAVAGLARRAGTPYAISSVVTDIYQQALQAFGDVDGELMGAAFLEAQAGRTLHADVPNGPTGTGE